VQFIAIHMLNMVTVHPCIGKKPSELQRDFCRFQAKPVLQSLKNKNLLVDSNILQKY